MVDHPVGGIFSMNHISEALPLVTIVAISYNQEKFIVESLNSIKNQTYQNIQLIIADDGSSDQTKQLIKKWVKENWQEAIFLDHIKNKGVTKNLNSALPYIKGKYYQFFGCEDIMLPEKISIQVKILEANPSASVAYSDMYKMDVNGNMDERTYYQQHTYNKPCSGMIYENILERCFVSTPTALMRTEVLLALGGDNEKLEVNDFDFWMRAAKKFNFLFHPDITMKYRVLSTSISARSVLFHYKNGFLVYYYNYDRRKPYKLKFDSRMLFSIKNLYGLQFKKTSLFALKAFLKSGKLEFLYYTLKGYRYLFNGKMN